MNKYKAKPTVVDGVRFHSKAEAEHYVNFREMQKAGLISDLELQPPFPIEVNGFKVCTYFADFQYLRDGERHVVDVKGQDTAISRLKRKLVKAVYGIDVEIIWVKKKKRGGKPERRQ